MRVPTIVIMIIIIIITIIIIIAANGINLSATRGKSRHSRGRVQAQGMQSSGQRLRMQAKCRQKPRVGWAIYQNCLMSICL